MFGDRYRPSPRSPIWTRSPPGMRHSFRPERPEASTSYDSYRPPRGPLRTDSFDHHKEPPKEPSPAHRSSRISQGQRSSVTTMGSPEIESNDPRGRPLYVNPTWTKPTASSTTIIRARNEVNGVKDVPSGPAGPDVQTAETGHGPLPEHVRRSPHIYISSQHLPAKAKTITHLKNYLRQHQPELVSMDDSGYYLKFPDSEKGRSRLEMCRKLYDGKVLFSSYTLVMETFVDGQRNEQPILDNALPKHPLLPPPEQDQQHDRGVMLPIEGSQTLPNARTIKAKDRLESRSPTTHELQIIDPRLRSCANLVSMPDPAQPEPPFVALEDVALTSTSRSSPHRGLAKSSHDDGASSVSGRASEASASGKRCHVCRKKSELDTLVGCSTCTRRYHRYCHLTTTIPGVPGPAWQCQRCCRRKIPPKRVLDDVVDEGVAESSIEPGLPPAKKVKITTVEPVSTVDHNATSLSADTPASGPCHDSSTEEQTPLDKIDENRFHETLLTTIRSNIGKDGFIIPQDKSVEALSSEHSKQIVKALNAHPSLDGPLRRKTSNMIDRRLATNTITLKELLRGGSTVDMLITSSSRAVEGKYLPEFPRTTVRADGGDATDTVGANIEEQPKTGASNTVAVPAPDQRQTPTDQVPAVAPLAAPTSEADDLVEQSFATSTGQEKAAPSDMSKTAPKLSLVRRKARPEALDSCSAPVNREVPDETAGGDTTTHDHAASATATSASAPRLSEVPIGSKERRSQDSLIPINEQVSLETTIVPQMITGVKNGHGKRDSTASISSTSGLPKRIKPQPTKLVRVDCAGCGRVKVPRHPSGRMLCVQCMQDKASVAPADPSVGGPELTSRPVEKTPENTLKEAQVNVSSNTVMPVDMTAGHTTVETEAAEIEPRHDGQLVSEATCADCKRRHRRCDHRKRPQVSTTCEDCRKRHNRCEHGTSNNEDDDLDFWSSKTTSTCERCGAAHDPTDCPVQSVPVAETLSASDQLFAVIESSQEKGLWAKGTKSDRTEVNTHAEEGHAAENNTQPTSRKDTAQVEVEPIPSPSESRRAGLKRKSQHRAAVDANDLGDLKSRPNGTFCRLIGMALLEAPGNRLDPAGVASWVAENIPGYSKRVGRWENGIKATMIMNAKTQNSSSRAERLEVDGRTWYQMLPHLIDTHERWNRELQRPVKPNGVRQTSQLSAKGMMDVEESDLEEAPTLPRPPRKSLQAKTTMRAGARQSRNSQSVTEGATDVDPDEQTIPKIVKIGLPHDSSEDEPLAAQQKVACTAAKAPMASFESSLALDATGIARLDGMPLESFDNTLGMQPGGVQAVGRAFLPKQSHAGHLPDELLLRALIYEELETRDYSVRSLEDDWPELHPDFQFDKNAKTAEIKTRPRRKQLIGKPPMDGTVNDLNAWQSYRREPFTVLRHDPFPSAVNDEEEDGTRSKRCRTLEDFLAVPDDLEPHILDEQLVYRHRNSRVRTVYKTGI